jgi:hypothetical protein
MGRLDRTPSWYLREGPDRRRLVQLDKTSSRHQSKGPGAGSWCGVGALDKKPSRPIIGELVQLQRGGRMVRQAFRRFPAVSTQWDILLSTSVSIGTASDIGP